MNENCMIEVTLVSMGPLAEWGPGQIAPVAPPPPPLGGPAAVHCSLFHYASLNHVTM